MSIRGLMNDTCTIATEVVSKSVNGGASINSWSTSRTNQPVRVCDLQPWQAENYYGRFGDCRIKRFYFATNPTLADVADHILWEGGYWQVISIENAGGNLQRLWQVDARFKVAWQGDDDDAFNQGFDGAFSGGLGGGFGGKRGK